MADSNGSFGRSKSMPLMGLGQLQETSQDPEQHKWKQALLNSPGLQRFRNNTASVWAPNGVQFLEPVIPLIADQRGDDADGDDVRSQSSSSTVKMSVGDTGRLGFDEGTSPTSFIPGSPGPDGSDTTTSSVVGVIYKRCVVPVTCDGVAPVESDTDITATEHLVQAMPGLGLRTNLSSPWNPTATNEKPRSRASSGAGSDATFMTDHSHTRSVSSVNSAGCMSSLPNHDPELRRDLIAMLHDATVANKPRATEDIHVPETLHHRRDSNKLSSLPAIRSPLGLGRIKSKVVSDGSGLIGTSPNLPRYLNWPQEHAAPQSPSIYGLHKRHPGLDCKDSPSQKTGGSGFGHGRNPADPFVERAEKSPCGQNPKHFDLRSPLPLTTPGRGVFPQTPLSVPQAGVTHTLIHSNIAPPARAKGPISLPPLPFVQHRDTRTPEARTVVEAQKVVREEWIRSEARKIAELNRGRFAAAQQYERTRSLEDYAIWSRTEAAFADGTNWKKRQEERRDMFLPQDPSAVGAGAESRTGDGFAGANQRGGGVANGGEGAGRLLGSQMAFTGRVCAEAGHGDQDRKEGGEAADKITAEMLDTLSVAEVDALREHLVARLRRGTDGRSCN